MSPPPNDVCSWTQTRRTAEDLFPVDAAHSHEANQENVVGTMAARILILIKKKYSVIFNLPFLFSVSEYLSRSWLMRGDGENVDRAATSWMVLFGGVFWISSSSLCALPDDFSSTGFKLRLFNPLFSLLTVHDAQNDALGHWPAQKIELNRD